MCIRDSSKIAPITPVVKNLANLIPITRTFLIPANIIPPPPIIPKPPRIPAAVKIVPALFLMVVNICSTFSAFLGSVTNFITLLAINPVPKITPNSFLLKL